MPWEAVVVSAGTGATAAGLLIGLKGSAPLHVASALKGLDMTGAIQDQLNYALNDPEWSREMMADCHVWEDAHAEGFGKIGTDVTELIAAWEAETGIEIDGVYTAKTLMRLKSAWAHNDRWRGRRVLFVHTGGLQGNRSWR